MISHIHKFREKLAAGRLCLGPGITFSDPAVSEALAESVDFLWIDLEHTPMSLEAMQGHLMAARAGGVPALVRVPTADVGWIKRVLDSGAEGIIFPQVKSAAEVRAAILACRYPALGTRGYGPRRPSHYGRDSGEKFLADSNRGIFAVAMIETVEAVEDLDGILAVETLDSIVVGPYDLSGSMGMLGQISHPRVTEVLREIVGKARRTGIPVGMGCGDDVLFARGAAEMGASWLQCGCDFGYLVSAAERLYRSVRGGG